MRRVSGVVLLTGCRSDGYISALDRIKDAIRTLVACFAAVRLAIFALSRMFTKECAPSVKLRLILFSALSFCTLFPVAANADTFDLSFVFGDVNNDATVTSAVLTTTDTEVGGAYTITGITGTYSLYLGGTLDVSRNIAGLFVPDTSYSADDLLYMNGGPYLDVAGLTFTLQGGAYGGDDFLGDVNIYYYNGAYYEPIEITTAPGTLTVTPASSAVPEPASFGFAAIAFAVFVFRRYRRAGSNFHSS